MKPLIFTYSEGNAVKILVASKQKKQLKIEKLIHTKREVIVEEAVEETEFAGMGLDSLENDDIPMGKIEDVEESPQNNSRGEDIRKLAKSLDEYNIKKSELFAVATAPSLNYHIYDGSKLKNEKKQKKELIEDIANSKNIAISEDMLDYVHLNDDSLIAAFLADDIPSVNIINEIAAHNKKKFYKLNSIKSGEIALANYVANNYKFLQEDLSLILHVGKEQSNIIFLEGTKLHYIGATLEIGSANLSTYDVYFSKILLEMENANIPRLDNVILCGEYDSESLTLSFYGSFPEANIIELSFENIDTENLTSKKQESLIEYSALIAAAQEYLDEVNSKQKGIDILPNYIREEQKSFQMSWHGYLVIPLIFGSAFFFTTNILENQKTISSMNQEIERLTRLQEKNKELLTNIANYEKRIQNFDETMTILNEATSGTKVYSNVLGNVSDFIGKRRNFWITQLQNSSKEESNLTMSGYSLSRTVLTEFVDENNFSLLNNIIYEPLRDYRAFEFNLELNFGPKEKEEKVKESKNN